MYTVPWYLGYEWWSTNSVCYAQRQIRGTLGSLAIIRRQRCHRTLGNHAKAKRNSHNCLVEARRPNLSAHRQQGHPIDGNRSGRGQPWIMDARCHAMHAGTRQGAFRSCTACIRSPNQTRWPTPSTELPPTEKQQQRRQPTRHMFSFWTVLSSLTLRAACSGIAPWLSEF